uniref:Uncharacterized protein n=1 Tax=Oryza meridionalis TaxID=40149 RepID=A0A0E0EMW6_9ORYZ
MGLPRNTAARFVGAHIGLAGPQAGLPPPTRPLLRRPAADEAPTTEGDQMHGGSASSGARGWLSGTPFISGLDLRPLKAELYLEATANQSLLLLNHDRPPARFAFNWRPASYYKLFSFEAPVLTHARPSSLILETKITSIRMGMRELLGVYHKAPPLFHPVVITPFVYLEVVCQRVDY